MSARLDHLEAQDRRSMQMKHSRESHFRSVALAERMGFSPRLANFAASVIGSELALNRRTPTADEVRQRMQAQWPFLFEEGR